MTFDLLTVRLGVQYWAARIFQPKKFLWTCISCGRKTAQKPGVITREPSRRDSMRMISPAFCGWCLALNRHWDLIPWDDASEAMRAEALESWDSVFRRMESR